MTGAEVCDAAALVVLAAVGVSWRRWADRVGEWLR